MRLTCRYRDLPNERPAVISAIRWETRRAATRLRRFGYDREDLNQELAFHWFQQRRLHDSRRGSPQTFAAQVCRRKAISILETAMTAKRGGGSVYSFSELATVDNDCWPIEQPKKISADMQEMRLRGRVRSASELADLLLDLKRVVDGLPADLFTMVQMLMDGESPVGIARRLKISRSSVYRRIERLRRVFRHAGLDRYLLSKGPQR
jgi:DNA-directed RNA polymerase specialized sigma24 family protein